MRTILICLVVCIASCSELPEEVAIIEGASIAEEVSTAQITRVVIHEEVGYYSWAWEEHVAATWPRAVMVYGHGYSIDDEWYVRSTNGIEVKVLLLIQQLQSQYPDRRIVLIICNPGAHEIDIERVSYTLRKVWVIPDSLIEPAFREHRDALKENPAGNLHEFVHNPS